MRVNDDVRECVAFIGLNKGDYRATGFLATVPVGPEGFLPYFVTARHNTDRIVGRESVIRLNTVAPGRSGHIVLNPDTRWYVHPTDQHVDLAVLPLTPPPEIFAYKSIPTSMFVSDDVIRERNIGIGDEVFIVGLFSRLAGSKRNVPIVRVGNLAMMPGEKVPTKLGDVEAYLVEARSLGGVSGSPVFVRETTSIEVQSDGHPRPLVGTGAYFLLGIMHGHWNLPAGATVSDTLREHEDESINTGIAVVTPATMLLELLYQPELVEMRERRMTEIRKNKPPRMG